MCIEVPSRLVHGREYKTDTGRRRLMIRRQRFDDTAPVSSVVTTCWSFTRRPPSQLSPTEPDGSAIDDVTQTGYCDRTIVIS